MIPNKIYIAHEYSEIDVLPPGVTSTRVFNKDVEYLRKDALVEWLKGYNHPVTRIVVQELIDKINSL